MALALFPAPSTAAADESRAGNVPPGTSIGAAWAGFWLLDFVAER